MKRTDLAYVAGIIDGEGCITITKDKRPTYPGFQLRIQVNMANEWLPAWLRFSFGGSLREIVVKENQQRQWAWIIQSNSAMQFLKLVLPYLKIKRSQAELCMEMQRAKDTRRKGGKWRARTSIEREAEEIAYNQIRGMHKGY